MNHKLSLGLAMLPLVPAVQAQEQGRQDGERPNIIFIMSDDHAQQAMSIYGHPIGKVAPTPNIDRIGQEGAVFWNNYCCNSISGPSRAAILTGKHSHKNGFMKNWALGFDGSQQTLPKLLQQGGYETAVIGKWHLISKPTGFDHWMILNDQGEYCNPQFITEGDTTIHKGYVTDLITQYCEEWMDNGRDKNKPFFLMMHHKAIHRNWVPAERHYRLYEHAKFPLPDNYYDAYEGRYAAQMQKMNIYRDMYEGHDLKMVAGIDSDSLLFDPWPHAFMGTMTPEERRRFLDAYRDRNNEFYSKPRSFKEVAEWKYQRYLQDYMACVASVDESVGEILDYLKRTGLDKNTIVVYTTDQGFYLGEHGWFDKRFMYEECQRMPLIIRYPKAIKAGSTSNAISMNVDFAPTFLDFAGIEIPSDIQGASLKPVLVNEGKTPADWRKAAYYHYYEYPAEHSVKRHYGIRTQDFKLIHFYNDIDEWEMYDMKADPREMNNVFGKPEYAEKQKELMQLLQETQKQYKDTDPDEKEKVLFKGDRRLMKNR